MIEVDSHSTAVYRRLMLDRLERIAAEETIYHLYPTTDSFPRAITANEQLSSST
jgi:hypothetical protein